MHVSYDAPIPPRLKDDTEIKKFEPKRAPILSDNDAKYSKGQDISCSIVWSFTGVLEIRHTFFVPLPYMEEARKVYLYSDCWKIERRWRRVTSTDLRIISDTSKMLSDQAKGLSVYIKDKPVNWLTNKKE